MERKSAGYLAACIFLAILYIVGRIGLENRSWQAIFMELVPVNLLITAVLVFLFHKSWNSKFLVSYAAIFIAGFVIEYLGVRTGIVFGEYYYGSSFGLKFLEIPVIIGLNWLLLIYCVNNILNWIRIKKNLQAAVTGSFLMIIIDYFLEPFAVKFDLWHWNSAIIPLQNYIAWFVLSFLMILFTRFYSRRSDINPVAIFCYFLQLIFFISFRF